MFNLRSTPPLRTPSKFRHNIWYWKILTVEYQVVKKCEDVFSCFHTVSHGKTKSINDRVREQTQLEKINLIITDRRLRWLGHVLRMDDNRLPRQAVHWDVSGSNRKPVRPRKNWIDTIQQDLKSIALTWEVAQQLAVNTEGWRRRVAQCVFDELTSKVRTVIHERDRHPDRRARCHGI